MTATLPARRPAASSSASSPRSTRRWTHAASRSRGRSRPITSAGAGAIDVTHRASATRRRPTTRERNPQVSLLFSRPHRVRHRARPAPCSCRARRAVDDADLDANRERYWRESGEKLPATKELHPPSFMRGLFELVLHAHLRLRAPGAGLRLERRRLRRRADALRRAPRGGALAALRRAARPSGPRPRAAPPDWDDRMDELGRRHETAVLTGRRSGRLPDVDPRCRSSPTGRRTACGSASMPDWMPARPARACLTAHEHEPRVRVADQLPGPRRPRPRGSASWSLVPHKMVGGFELPEDRSSQTYSRTSARCSASARRRRPSWPAANPRLGAPEFPATRIPASTPTETRRTSSAPSACRGPSGRA